MSSLIERIRRIYSRTPEKEPKTKTEILSKVYSLEERKGAPVLVSGIEERITKLVPTRKLLNLYKVDGLTFATINKYISYVVGPGYFFEGDEEIVRELEEWSEEVGLKQILEEVVRDIFLTGNAWVELGYNKRGTDILKLKTINPELMDYIRDDETGFVKLDKWGDPEGYVRHEGLGILEKIEWRRDSIKRGQEIVWRQRFAREDGRDRIAHFKFFGLGESYLGDTPLERGYFAARRKVNVEENVGESASRSGGIVVYVSPTETGRRLTADQIDKIGKALKKVGSKSIFVFRDNIRVERFPAPEVENIERQLYYFADEFCSTMGIPLSLVMEPYGRGYRTDIPAKAIDFQLTINSLQERLALQLRNNILRRVLKARRRNPQLLKRVVFQTAMPLVRRERSREIATLARRGLITRDPEIEKRLREELGLPTSFVDREFEIWKEEKKKVPEAKKEIDVKEQLVELKEKREE